eukprot:Hpha_TRINITY_DN15451_c2_g1::TRINITY_DN15451_c2_g1_i18::g.174839::m.174839/K05916/hmp, YHB1; nitric oxide dioxygenase
MMRRMPINRVLRMHAALKLRQQRDLSQKSLDIVKATLPAVAEAGPAFTKHFYARMFKAHPELLDIFNTTNQKLGKQSKALFNSIAYSASYVLQHGALPVEVLEPVHHKHCALGVLPAQYDVVGEHIIGTIVDLLNPPQEVLDGWGELYTALAAHCKKREEELYAEMGGHEGGWRGERTFIVESKKPQSDTVTH